MGRKKTNKYKAFKDLSEKEKDEILNWIVVSGNAISKASLHFKLTVPTINKIFETRYNIENKVITNKNEENYG
jgi:hypothetical protein